MFPMFGLTDLVALLDRWGEWKRIKSAADRVPELANRIEALEDRLAGKGGTQCPQCASLDVRLTYSGPTDDEKKILERWECMDCDTPFDKLH